MPGVAPAYAEADAALLELREGEASRPIPNGLGMQFFQGKWDHLGRGGSFPVTVTDKALINDEAHVAAPYRVLVEDVRYVLIAELVTLANVGIFGEAFTLFGVLTLQSHWGKADPYSQSAHMIFYYCLPESMNGGAHAFS